MNTKLYVGNLSYTVETNELQTLFEQAGTVTSVAIPTDRETGRKRGFAFVEMQDQAQAEAAMKAFDGQDFAGRQLVVNMARPKTRNW